MLFEAIAIDAVKSSGQEAVRAILALESETVRLLRAADGKLDALREGSYHAGREFLQAADRAGADSNRREEQLLKARDRFMDARGAVRGDPLVSSFTALHLALLDQTQAGEARHWAAVAHEDAVQATKNRVATVMAFLDSINPDKSRSIKGAAAAGGVGFGWISLSAGIAFLPAVGIVMAVGVPSALLYQRIRLRRLNEPVRDIASLDEYVAAVGELRARLGEPRSAIQRYKVVFGEHEASYVGIASTT